MNKGGFDCVLGNPPWEKTKLQEKEFFLNRIPSISKEGNKSRRSLLIDSLETSDNESDREIYRDYLNEKRFADTIAEYSKSCMRYQLISGETNLYSLFCESSIRLKGSSSSLGLILPSGIVADESNKRFAKFFIDSQELRLFGDFINKHKIFEGVVPNQQFCLLTLSSLGDRQCRIASRMQTVNGLSNMFEINADEIALMNPNTLNIPAISGERQKDILVQIYKNSSHLCKENNNGKESGWDIEFNRMFDMSLDSSLFMREKDLRGESHGRFREDWSGEHRDIEIVPLYEAKLFDAYNHKYSTFEGVDESKMFGTKPQTLYATPEQLNDEHWHPKPRYWVQQEQVEERVPKKWTFPWLVGFRNALSSSADTRSLRTTIIPRYGAGNSFPLIYEYSGKRQCFALVGLLNSIVMDFVVKQKVSGANLNFYILKQLPIPNLSTLTDRDLEFISSRVERLSFTSTCFTSSRTTGSDNASDGTQCHSLKSTREELKAEIDAYTAKLYGLERDELEYIYWDKSSSDSLAHLATFEVLRSVEIREFGEYRSRRLGLEAWDRLFGG